MILAIIGSFMLFSIPLFIFHFAVSNVSIKILFSILGIFYGILIGWYVFFYEGIAIILTIIIWLIFFNPVYKAFIEKPVQNEFIKNFNKRTNSSTQQYLYSREEQNNYDLDELQQPTTKQKYCSTCGLPMKYINKYYRDYCYYCKKYK